MKLRMFGIIGGSVSALVLAGSLAYAAIPDSAGVIHGCYDNKTGTVRVVDTDNGGSCTSKETSLNWSQTGPQGPTGPAGPGVSIYYGNAIFQGSSGEVSCQPGDPVVGGGIASGSGSPVVASRPINDVTGANDTWYGAVVGPGPIEVWVICEGH